MGRLDCRIERLEQIGRLDPHRPILVGKRRAQGGHRCSSAVLGQRFNSSGARIDHQISFATLVGGNQRLLAPFRLDLAEVGRCGCPNADVLFSEMVDENLADVGCFQSGHRRQHRGHDAGVGVGQHRRHPRQRTIRIFCRKNRRQTGTHTPMRIGVEPRQRDEERIVVALGQPLESRESDRR